MQANAKWNQIICFILLWSCSFCVLCVHVSEMSESPCTLLSACANKANPYIADVLYTGRGKQSACAWAPDDTRHLATFPSRCLASLYSARISHTCHVVAYSIGLATHYSII